MFDELDAVQANRLHSHSTAINHDFINRKLSMSPYLNPTSKLSSALAHTQSILGTNLPLRRQISNKSSLSLAGGVFFPEKLLYYFGWTLCVAKIFLYGFFNFLLGIFCIFLSCAFTCV